MQANHVYIDDLLFYNATAREVGEDGEIVEVRAPGTSEWIKVGGRYKLQLEYDSDPFPVSEWYYLESIVEDLETGEAALRFRLDETN